MRHIFILGVRFDVVSFDEALLKIREYLGSNTLHFVATPNPEVLLYAHKNPSYREILNTSSLNIPDGIGILWASTVLHRYPFSRDFSFFRGLSLVIYAFLALLSIPFFPSFCRKVFPENVTGADLTQAICSLEDDRMKVFLLGAAPGIAQKTASILQKKNPSLHIVGTASLGYTGEDEKKAIEEIRNSHASVLFLAYGSPHQEEWIYRNIQYFPSLRVAIGVGGTFDFIAGKRKRAPRVFRILGLEWLFRLVQEPKRIGRIFNATIFFPIIFLFQYFRGKSEKVV